MIAEDFIVRDDNGDRLWHYEWMGWWWCDREEQAFDWTVYDVDCPHCGETFHVPPAAHGKVP